MKPYAKLSKAEAEAKTAEAERKKGGGRTGQKREGGVGSTGSSGGCSRSSGRKGGRGSGGYDTGITYEQLARTPDDYMAKR